MVDKYKSIREVFSETGRMRSWLDVEIALAEAEAELGMIPAEAAASIAAMDPAEVISLDRYEEFKRKANHILVAFIRMCQSTLPKDAGEFLHYGATTQDICDTAMMLRLKQLTELIREDFVSIAEALSALAAEHKDTLMVARTNSIQALPITFGFKAAGWVSELRRDIARLDHLLASDFVLQLGGAVGTLAAFGEHGFELQTRAAEKLGLQTADIAWHSSRDRMSEIASVYALCSNTLSRIAQEVYRLMETEISEVYEPWSKGVIGSSTMPHKINPHRSLRIIFNSRAIRYRAAEIFEGAIVDHERNITYCTDEMDCFEQIGNVFSHILEEAVFVFSHLTVNQENMRKNLDLLGGTILSESLMFELGKHVGKQTAHQLINGAATEALRSGLDIKQVLLKNGEIAQYLSPERIDELLDPAKYIGRSVEITERITAGETPGNPQKRT